jgi:hypothetical protein
MMRPVEAGTESHGGHSEHILQIYPFSNNSQIICFLFFLFWYAEHPPARLPAHPPIHLPTYGSTFLLLDLGRFFSFLILYRVGRTPWTGDHIEQHKHRINAQRHPCLEWDSNPRSPRSSERRQFIA